MSALRVGTLAGSRVAHPRGDLVRELEIDRGEQAVGNLANDVAAERQQHRVHVAAERAVDLMRHNEVSGGCPVTPRKTIKRPAIRSALQHLVPTVHASGPISDPIRKVAGAPFNVGADQANEVACALSCRGAYPQARIEEAAKGGEPSSLADP